MAPQPWGAIIYKSFKYNRIRARWRASVANLRLARGRPDRELPLRTDEMAGVPVGNSLQIVLMFRFRLPEIARRRDLRHDLSGPQT